MLRWEIWIDTDDGPHQLGTARAWTFRRAVGRRIDIGAGWPTFVGKYLFSQRKRFWSIWIERYDDLCCGGWPVHRMARLVRARSFREACSKVLGDDENFQDGDTPTFWCVGLHPTRAQAEAANEVKTERGFGGRYG